MAEPIYPPTYPCSAGVTSIPYALPMTVGGWTFDDVELVAKQLLVTRHETAVLDDSPAALIARLTSGDAGGEWGHQRVDFYVARCRATGRRYEVVSAATESDQLEVTRITAPTYAEARRKVGEYLAAGS